MSDGSPVRACVSLARDDDTFPLFAFVRAFREHRAGQLEPFLDEAVVYAVDGFPALQGRAAVLAYWRRMFDTHAEIHMSVSRRIQDGGVIIAAQRQAYAFLARPPVVVESLVVYELRAGRIVSWRDSLQAEDLGPEEEALWRRLREARW